MMTTGKVGSTRLMSFWISMPDLPGSIRSNRTASYKLSSIFLSPSSPVPALSDEMPSEVSSNSMLSRISSSSSIMRTTPFRLDIYRFPCQRQFQSESRSHAGLALHRDIPAVFLNNSVADGQAKSRSFTCRFRREERVVNLFYVFAADPGSGVLNQDFDFRIHGVGQYPQLAAFRHRVTGVHEQIQEYLLELAGVAGCNRAFGPKLALDADAGTLELMVEQ